MNHTALGKKGEAQALEFLKKKGYKELAMNWRIDPYEIDLIMIDKDHLVFVDRNSFVQHICSLCFTTIR